MPSLVSPTRCLVQAVRVVRAWALVLTCAALVPSTAAAGDPWAEMDYGPSLAATLEIQPGHVVCKGLAVRLDPGPGGVAAGKAFGLFDTDTLQFAAGWSGPGFIDWRNIAFNGEHGVHASIVGRLIFANPNEPGWASVSNGSFRDERLRGRDGKPYGPMPKTWGQWKGQYVHGPHVVFSYRVGDADILELPGLEEHENAAGWTRTLQVGPRSGPLTMQVLYRPGFGPTFHDVRETQLALDQIVAFEPARSGQANRPGTDRNEAPSNALTLAVVGQRADLAWAWDEAGNNLRLRLPAGSEPLRFKIVYLDAPAATATPDQSWLRQCPEPNDLALLTQGGPERWNQAIRASVRVVGNRNGPYWVEDLGAPMDNPYRSWMRLGGFDFYADADAAAVCTWQGDVWRVEGLAGSGTPLSWRRIASGMFQPLGLRIVRDEVYVTCRDQITRLRDLNGDGETDFYESFNHDAQVTPHFHEFAMDLQTDAAGNFYYAKAACHAQNAVVPHHGTLIQVSPDGQRSEVIAAGFRAPNGVCVNADGTFFISDQEGHWTPKNRINLVRTGGFYGYMMGWCDPDRSANDFEPPVVWIHNSFDRSPAEQIRVSHDRWGLPKDSLLSLSYGTGAILLVLAERVGEVTQGGVVKMPIPELPTGVMRGRFHPGDDSLYVCGLFGWAGDKTRPGGFYRVRYTGKPVEIPVALETLRDGLRFRFTEPLDPDSAGDPDRYAAERFQYRREANYGSKDYKLSQPEEEGRDPVSITAAELGEDGKSVYLRIPDMQPSMQLEIKYRIQTAAGARLQHRIETTVHTVPVEK